MVLPTGWGKGQPQGGSSKVYVFYLLNQSKSKVSLIRIKDYPVRVYMYLASMPNDTTGLPISPQNIIVLYCIPYYVVQYIFILLCCNHVVLSYHAVYRAQCGEWAV